MYNFCNWSYVQNIERTQTVTQQSPKRMINVLCLSNSYGNSCYSVSVMLLHWQSVIGYSGKLSFIHQTHPRASKACVLGVKIKTWHSLCKCWGVNFIITKEPKTLSEYNSAGQWMVRNGLRIGFRAWSHELSSRSARLSGTWMISLRSLHTRRIKLSSPNILILLRTYMYLYTLFSICHVSNFRGKKIFWNCPTNYGLSSVNQLISAQVFKRKTEEKMN